MVDGFWNGLPTQIRKVVGTVRPWQKGDPPLAWWRELVGEKVHAVEVNLDGVNEGGGLIYIWDKNDGGWLKVTEGKGSPIYPHYEVPLIDIEAE